MLMKESQKHLNQYLSSSIQHGDFGRAKEHIKNGANINYNGGELLIQSVMKNDKQAVKFLVENKVKFNTTHQNLTPIMSAFNFSDNEMVKYLVENGADVNEKDGSPIERASEKQDFELVKYFHEHGAKLNSEYDRVLRDLSCHSVEALAWCFENGGKPEKPAYLVNHCAELGKPECLTYLADKGMRMDEVEYDGEYPLHVAARAGRTDNVEILLNRGIDPNDQKALYSAIINGHLDTVKTFVERGADPTANNNDPLYQAITYGQDDITKYLIVENKMPVSDGIRIWLNEAHPNNTSTTFARQLLEKRDLNERLQQKYQRPATTTKSKSQSLKI